MTPQGKNTPPHKPIKQFAEDMRFNSTLQEGLMWNSLLLAFNPYRATVHAQEPIGPYIADFYIAPCNVVVEVDGPYHGHPDQKAKDKRRDTFMRNKGIRIFRFQNIQVVRSARACAQYVLAKCLPLEYAVGKVRIVICPPGDASGRCTKSEKRLFWRS
jgi:very-short-patch-repair endonuclease